MSNTYITDLIRRDLDGEDVGDRADAYNDHYLGLFEVILQDYLNQYHLFGDAQVMCVKLLWDYAFYWSYPAFWFFQDKWTDLEFIKDTRAEYERAVELTKRMQALFREWHKLGNPEFKNSFVTLFPWLLQKSDELDQDLDDATLRQRAKDDLEALEAFAIMTFEKAARQLENGTVDRKAGIDAYAVTLDSDRWDKEKLFDGEVSLRDARKRVNGLQFAWIDEFGGDVGPVS